MKAWLAILGLLLGMPALDAVAASANPPLNMGFYLPGIRDANMTDIRSGLQYWADEMGRSYDLQAKALLYDEMPQIRRDELEGALHLVIAPGMEMAETFTPEELTDGFIGVRPGGEEGLALIIRAKSGIRGFADLKGKKVLHLSNDRLSSVFLEVQCMKAMASACSEMFTSSEEKRDVLAIHKVFFGQADAALVSRNALYLAGDMNPQVRDRLRTLFEWKVRSLNFGMMTVHSPSTYRERVLKSALDASRTVRGRQILELFKVEHMRRADRTDLQPFWQLLKDYRDLMQTRPARKK